MSLSDIWTISLQTFAEKLRKLSCILMSPRGCRSGLRLLCFLDVFGYARIISSWFKLRRMRFSVLAWELWNVPDNWWYFEDFGTLGHIWTCFEWSDLVSLKVLDWCLMCHLVSNALLLVSIRSEPTRFDARMLKARGNPRRLDMKCVRLEICRQKCKCVSSHAVSWFR